MSTENRLRALEQRAATAPGCLLCRDRKPFVVVHDDEPEPAGCLCGRTFQVIRVVRVRRAQETA